VIKRHTTWVWRKRGIASLENATKQQVMWLVASVCKPRLRQALARCRQCADMCRPEIG